MQLRNSGSANRSYGKWRALLNPCTLAASSVQTLEKLKIFSFAALRANLLNNCCEKHSVVLKLLERAHAFLNNCGFDLLFQPGAACSHWRSRAARLHSRFHSRFQSEIAVAFFDTAIRVFNCISNTLAQFLGSDFATAPLTIYAEICQDSIARKLMCGSNDWRCKSLAPALPNTFCCSLWKAPALRA